MMWTYFLVTAVALSLAVLAVAAWRAYELRGERRAKREIADLASMGEVIAAGRYPKIDPDRCIGSGACVAACPEKGVIAVVDGRATLANPLGCVSHGVCADACPLDAITLVYGSENIGVHLPQLDEELQSNVPGLYVCGDATGIGLIRNAVNQGRGAARSILESARRGSDGVKDLLVVGAGPAGISTTLAAMEAGLEVEMLDREQLGGTILHYPRAKLVMTGKLELPLYGTVRRSTMKKEELVELWNDIDRKVGLPLRSGELVDEVVRREDGTFEVHSTRGWSRAANVVLALGQRGSPRKLGVPGEESAKVAYQLLEPAEFAGKHALVVGGGNSAVESAIALAEQGECASVAVSYRRGVFARCRGENRARIAALIEAGEVLAKMESTVAEVGERDVRLAYEDGRTETLRNDAVIVQIGGTPPSALLDKFGVRLVEKRGHE